jgi:hypothetical protein
LISPTTITLPRIDGESSRAYAARVEYVTMGPQRSIDKLADQNGIKTGSRVSRYLEWSRKYGWVSSAEKYDSEIALITVNDAAEKHRADLEEHRKKAMDAGRSLYGVAGQMLHQLNVALANPKKIKGEDGKWYTLHGIEITSATLTTVARALQTALDLSAHALGVDSALGEHDSE